MAVNSHLVTDPPAQRKRCNCYQDLKKEYCNSFIYKI